MYNDALNNVLAFASVLAVFVMALVQLVKNSVKLPRNLVPAVGLKNRIISRGHCLSFYRYESGAASVGRRTGRIVCHGPV